MTGAIDFLWKWKKICRNYRQCGLCPLQGICNATPKNFVEIPLLVYMVNEVYRNELPKN